MKEKNTKTEYKKTTHWFLELVIWFFVLFVIASAISFYHTHKTKELSRYQIFLQDVDGIIQGSPVRMLGIQVGYVKKVKIVNDMVFVDFIITEKGISIPKGSRVTVEFTGLGGSKSLEIYLPKDKATPDTSFLIIQQPRRLGYALSLLDSMLEKISQITYKCTSFGKEIHFSTTNEKHTPTEQKEMLNNADVWIDKIQKDLEKTQKK